MEFTGHVVGGICPFGLKQNLLVFLDISLKRFNTFYTSCGSSNSAVKITCDELKKYSLSKSWGDVARDGRSDKAIRRDIAID